MLHLGIRLLPKCPLTVMNERIDAGVAEELTFELIAYNPMTMKKNTILMTISSFTRQALTQPR